MLELANVGLAGLQMFQIVSGEKSLPPLKANPMGQTPPLWEGPPTQGSNSPPSIGSAGGGIGPVGIDAPSAGIGPSVHWGINGFTIDGFKNPFQQKLPDYLKKFGLNLLFIFLLIVMGLVIVTGGDTSKIIQTVKTGKLS